MSALITLAASMQSAFSFLLRNAEPSSEVAGGGHTNFDYSPPKSLGPQGPAGADGSDGADGATGAPGQSLEGAAGERGETGEKGEKGDDGNAGPAGEPGTNKAGIPGPRGPRGKAGKNGPQGPQGPQGYPGRDGVSIPGPQGEQGPQGPPALKTAILPAHGRYHGIIAQESREVFFEDILRITLPPHTTTFTALLDPLYLATLQPGTLFITALLPNHPVHVHAQIKTSEPPSSATSKIKNNQSEIFIRLQPLPHPLRLTLTLHGIRRGMQHIQDRHYSADDLIANNTFYRAAHQSMQSVSQ